ncbi:MAG: tetratricopeptide repeat protein [Deltaproteobacteria bacterium]|nr:tetratricopeptide repeat protein [Deltaproteobacteria bacterium]MBW1992820.1 tetratricopeptide repeat protein [Deltaproteobacteria bacterium]MBW2153132.1 tetratricopeptide repeat protein [Deltaproteobacteria bacterium]
MSKKSDSTDDHVRKSTMMLVAFIALGVGFVGGVVFSAFKTIPRVPAPGPEQPAQPVKEQSISEEQARQILALEREVASNPDNVDAWTKLGHLYFDANNFESAIRAYEKSLELKPDNADVQTDLGVMYRRNGQPEQAIKAFNKAIEIDPEHEISRFNKGVVLLHDLNDHRGAIEAWAELLKINPAATTPSGQPLGDLLKKLKQTARP